MPSVPADFHLPRPGERGLASHDLGHHRTRILGAWDAFLDLAEDVDLEAPSRLPGWRGHDVLAHLGTWGEDTAADRMLAEARGTSYGDVLDQDARNAALVAEHRDASRSEVLDALVVGREAMAGLLDSPDLPELAERRLASILGPLPLLSLICASTYELAVHALDLEPSGAPTPPPELTLPAVGALVDITGALCARQGITATAVAMTPHGGWVVATVGPDWTTVELPAGPVEGVGVEAEAATLLDVSAGRQAVPPLLVRRELRAHGTAGLMALAPIVEAVPGLPGGGPLRAAARYVGGVGRLVSRLPGLG